MAELQIEIVAADHFVWSGAAKKLIRARTVNGEIGVLPGHVPTLSVLAAGDLEIEPVSGSRFTVQIDGGFLSVDSDRVVIVADNAVLENAA